MLRTTMFVGVYMMATLAPAAAQPESASTSRAPWCTINPAQPMQGQWVRIAESKIHIVLASKQADAKNRLSDDAFVKVDSQEVTQLVGNPAELFAPGNYYLVRASAFYVDQNYNMKSRLEANLYPMEKALQIVNTSLSQPGTTPTDIAIVVES